MGKLRSEFDVAVAVGLLWGWEEGYRLREENEQLG